ncbi:NADP-dependent oxidoreductase domain-containing protein [Cokeromyces recurvatus]|uniref:NADP-dependent oxidoreductase domain-containing protein n=1 Tax=Cokeromyces recurvatus TaxID=90255 RepID=UPI0022208FE6|nr:NADP-dependent oxidoreductase domain-containing protein [Cokeromyces recurvatus]KAI7905907.1 NADP-dependent oxidoreductase domain-containing protein [Cokeromyces recurvatus]
MAKPVSQDYFKPSEVSFGAGALSGSYDQFSESDPVEACREALNSGINTFDTSPYYGKSECILGDALYQIRDEFPRNTYYLATKVGRYGYTVKDFDYSARRVYESVAESMRRMHTDYIDIVYCHDVEFVEFEQVVGHNQALEALFDLKSQGKIKYVGCSGYPLEVLLKIAKYNYDKGQPLDIILSYCHYTLQNTLLADYAPKFKEVGVRYIMNASPLCMALLRDGMTPSWHPAHEAIREAADKAAAVAAENGLSLANLASRFSFQGRDQFQLDSTVIGLARKSEVQDAIRSWKDVKERKNSDKENKVYEIIHQLFAPYKNFSWQSPTDKELCKE